MEQPVKKKISVWIAIRNAFKAINDSLGFTILSSIAFFILSAAFYSVEMLLLKKIAVPYVAAIALIMGWFLFQLLTGIYYYTGKKMWHEDPDYKDIFRGIKILILPSTALFIIDLLITAVLVGDIAIVGFLPKHPAILNYIATISLFISIIWFSMLQYQLPILGAQFRMESGPKPLVVLKKSYLLMADNPGFTLVILLVIIAFAVICSAVACIGLLVIYTGLSAFILTSALRELYKKYGIVEEEPDVILEDNWKLPGSKKINNGPTK